MRVLDSDHCVAAMRAQLDLSEHATSDEELAVTSIGLGELVHGAARSRRAAQNLASLDVLLAAVTVLSYDEECARIFGQLKAELGRVGQRMSDLDLQIGSVALSHDAPLVTHNRRHFLRLVDVAGLVLEDWLG